MTDQERISLADFLETIPPSQARIVQAKIRVERRKKGNDTLVILEISWPEIQLHCTHANCNGIRFFEPSENNIFVTVDAGASEEFVTYTCRNCRQTARLFAVLANTLTHRQPDGKPATVEIEFTK